MRYVVVGAGAAGISAARSCASWTGKGTLSWYPKMIKSIPAVCCTNIWAARGRRGRLTYAAGFL